MIIVHRLRAGRAARSRRTTTGLPYSAGDELVRPAADHGRHVAGSDERVEAEVGRVEDRLDGRDDRDVVAEHREVRRRPRPWRAAASAPSTGRWSRSRSRRTPPAGPGSPWRSAVHRAASRPCGCRHLGPWRRGANRCRPGTRIMSPKQVRITSSCFGDRRCRRRPGPSGSRTPDSPARGRARSTRAASRARRSGRSSGCARRTPPSPCSGGRVRMCRRCDATTRLPTRDRGTRRRTSRDLLHPQHSNAGVHQQPIARANRADEVDRDDLDTAVVVDAAGGVADDRHDVERDPTSPHVMQTSSPQSPATSLIRSATPAARRARRRSPVRA